ncbi:hypothetical protein U9M48_035327 [Paspalum notatum var. saurae]|uniref:Uncharacterized protein n=1 Tax=Paspalum notatum var. saurae TaxID=547442 RepID=A0AAQ3UBG6_PASNO
MLLPDGGPGRLRSPPRQHPLPGSFGSSTPRLVEQVEGHHKSTLCRPLLVGDSEDISVPMKRKRQAPKKNVRMNHRIKQVAKGFAGRIIPSKEMLFQGTSTSGFRREEHEEEEAGFVQQNEEAGGGQEDEEEGAGQEDARADEDLMGGDGSEEVVLRRRTRKSHYINPPLVPTPADRRLIRPIGNGQWENVTWDGTGHRRTPNGVLGNLIQTHNPGVVTNAWLKSQGQPLGHFRDCSKTYLTTKEYEQAGKQTNKKIDFRVAASRSGSSTGILERSPPSVLVPVVPCDEVVRLVVT